METTRKQRGNNAVGKPQGANGQGGRSGAAQPLRAAPDGQGQADGETYDCRLTLLYVSRLGRTCMRTSDTRKLKPAWFGSMTGT